MISRVLRFQRVREKEEFKPPVSNFRLVVAGHGSRYLLTCAPSRRLEQTGTYRITLRSNRSSQWGIADGRTLRIDVH